MIVVIDYHKGNLKSVERGLVRAGAQVLVTDQSDALVLPGVGSFSDAVSTMERLGQMQAIKQALDRGASFLGICLGLHLMYESGVEGSPEPISGLGIFPGCVIRMADRDAEGHSFKVPHVGWNQVNVVEGFESCPLLDGIPDGENFYFTHSYIAPLGSESRATTQHSCVFPSIVQAGSKVFGVQFHPEKSSDAGARLLENFVRL